MGCGTVHYNGNKLQDSRPIFKPYPEEINGINDKVSNAFNNFLKSHGAITKPVIRERPKLNFDIKDTKNFGKMSVAEQSRSSVTQVNNLGVTDEAKQKKDLVEDSSPEPEEKSFFIMVPGENNQSKPKHFKFSITLDADKALKELNDLQSEAENITSKYL